MRFVSLSLTLAFASMALAAPTQVVDVTSGTEGVCYARVLLHAHRPTPAPHPDRPRHPTRQIQPSEPFNFRVATTFAAQVIVTRTEHARLCIEVYLGSSDQTPHAQAAYLMIVVDHILWKK
ncbi:hypothetical protein COCCADRAFT_27657 [Bipolaris zeicola 26-R-13]|uniref:Uncharacterized protein n=1 Tax=Cochliobolus carbonum (strain 26-R-13) TaxID=930089 RepID=W6Y1Y0_COCC2|nr:uncharacterized protein COCCADRAFT_27657 [Bipolaris zeicola 26-R-13]EUC31645.1 hypothetical protein COCCADRAFT_27657 [Bipolaris zeicola 26-R-13]